MSGLRGIRDGIEEYSERARADHHRLDLGLKFFADVTNGGIAPGELLMMVARAGVGKTNMALNAHRSHPDVGSLFFSLEMPLAHLTVRLAAMHCGVEPAVLEGQVKAGMKPPQFDKTQEDFPLFLCNDKSGLGIKSMGESMEEAKQILGSYPRLVSVDYLELVRSAGLATDQGQAVNRIAQACKEFAKHYDCSVILLHQANRGQGGSGNEPLTTNAARYGGDMAADYLMTAWRPAFVAGGNTAQMEELFLALPKNRHGAMVMAGVKHRLSSTCLRISAWEETPWAQPGESFSDYYDDHGAEVY